MARDKRLVGDAGAFLVAAELAKREWPSALTTAGTARTDILAQLGKERKLPAAIQVKTKSAGSKDFQPGSVREPAARHANEWVVLVALEANAPHRFYVVPRDVVVATVQAIDLAFDAPSRVFLGEHEYHGYLEAWGLLEAPAWEAPWRLPEWVFGRRHSMRWPDHHGGVPEDTEIIDP